MSMVRMMEERLPAGFRFHPRDEELVCDYLQKKISSAARSCCFSSTINGNSDHEFCSQMFIDVDLNKCEPWDLPEMACVGGKEWYFFNLHDRKYSSGQRTNRATQCGYWKATGKDRLVMRKEMLVGMRKTLVFYQGRAPTGKKTDWVMHEFRMDTKQHASNFSTKVDWVLCRVSFKSRAKAPMQMPAMTAADNHFYNYGSSSSSIPPLIHTCINFDRAHAKHDVIMPAAAVAHQPALPPPSEGHRSWRWARS